MRQVGKSAEYDPSFSANSLGIAICPKCKRELSETNDKTAENWWYCVECEHWIVTQPSHHERHFLGHESVLLLYEEGFDRKLIEYPGGYIKPYCPICKKAMWVEKMWWDRTDISGEEPKVRLVLGYVCEDWKNCGYTQTLKILTPLRYYDYLKSNKIEGVIH
jgi:hypothetical protein